MKILVLNAGSSSQKASLYEMGNRLPDTAPAPLWEAAIDWTQHQGMAEVKVKTTTGQRLKQVIQSQSRVDDTRQMLTTLWEGETQVIEKPGQIDMVGHRVVHGGQEYQESVLINPEVKAAIARLCHLAPAHNPANLEGIEMMQTILGTQVPQVAVFDTAFHARMPIANRTYPGPYTWLDQGIRRYGFHGISHQYCSQRAAQILGRELTDLRLITCHLGNGASLSAVQQGYSIDTTMGFTPLDGLMMGTRSGSVDPGILLHLLRNHHSVDELDRILNKESGLQGISGVSGDLRQVMTAIAEGNSRAQLALNMYIHRLRSCIGSMLASLGGLDALVFTAGVGENSPSIRAAACTTFEFLGLKLDTAKNESHPMDQDIATPDSTVRVVVIHTQEDWAIAQECWHKFDK